jgi:hypothetical protein
MLDVSDLEDKDAEVQSLLNTTIIDDLSRKAIDLVPKGQMPAFISPNVEVILSLANMRGVPYGLSTLGGGSALGHQMSLHADAVYFSLKPEGRGRFLNPLSLGLDDPAWVSLSDAARATSAFPVGLKARVLERPAADYNLRQWPVPQASPPPCVEGQEIPPSWSLGNHEAYQALYVDGGLMNNEPLELARVSMAGIGGRNPRHPSKAFRATLLIDPFPDAVQLVSDYQPKPGVIDVILSMFNALKMQARFKPDELSLALDNQSFSRFLLSPKRREVDGSITTPALQSAILGAFGGFLSQVFREHDYKLGRRNCEWFLKQHFYLAADNLIFKGWNPGAPYLANRPFGEGSTIASLPILPIENMGAEECPLPPRMSGQGAVDMNLLRPLIRSRVKRVVKHLLRNDFSLGGIARFFAKKALVGTILKRADAILEDELKKLD